MILGLRVAGYSLLVAVLAQSNWVSLRPLPLDWLAISL